jgi:hypothetical protein
VQQQPLATFDSSPTIERSATTAISATASCNSSLSPRSTAAQPLNDQQHNSNQCNSLLQQQPLAAFDSSLVIERSATIELIASATIERSATTALDQCHCEVSCHGLDCWLAQLCNKRMPLSSESTEFPLIFGETGAELHTFHSLPSLLVHHCPH